MISSLLNELCSRRLCPQGGFANHPGGSYRVDATAWTVLALMGEEPGSHLAEAARTRLASSQLKDGRVSLTPDHPEACWPTSLAVLAWHHAPAQQQAQSQGLGFLLNHTGYHINQSPDIPLHHNPLLKGWPWIDHTHSWVEPTALALIALKVTGHGEHPRAREAVQMLMDRQMSRGGWNYGNTVVFDQELVPFPECTGVALNALAGKVPREDIQKSLNYLNQCLARLLTPVSLAYALLGMGAWGEQPQGSGALVDQCLEGQEKYGPYDTASLSMLMVAAKAPAGLESFIVQ